MDSSAICKTDLDAQTTKGYFELVMGSTVDIGGTDNVIARFRQVTDGQKLRSQSRCGRYSSRSAFEGGDPLFENGGGRIGQAGIDIAELAQRKAVGTILRIVEHIGCSLVNGYGTGSR